MAIPVILPKQGQSVETCAIVGWKKTVGDAVRTGDVLCEVETDKASFEIESPADGTLLAIYHEAGSQVPVLETIALIGKPGEKADRPSAAPSAAASSAASSAASTPAASPAGRFSTAAAPAQTGASQTSTATIAAVAASGAAPAAAPAAAGRKIAASPRARALAAANGVALSGIPGTGPGGRIIERDVKQVIADGGRRAARPDARPAAGLPAAAALNALPSGSVQEIRVTGVRRLIAERMLASLTTTAQLTLNASADARALQELRARFKESPEAMGLRNVTINDMVLFAVSRALARHPDLNAHFAGDLIRQYADVHLGFAVDTPRGLIVPTIRNAGVLGLKAIAAEAARLAAACREGRVSPDELSGATFTVTNLGGLGVESFTPVLNPPQVGIVGIGAIVPRAAQGEGGSVSFIPQIGLSLTINHQVVDGAPGARFLQTLSGFIARFDLLLAQ
jgi:pyruvate dehydrogenase E2 component (dihydrolipoamide acetyltransferase)